MESEEFLSEGAAAVWAGVSAQTLRQFADVGYLRMESSKNGEAGYSRADIQRVFGVEQGISSRTQIKQITPLEEQIEKSSESSINRETDKTSAEKFGDTLNEALSTADTILREDKNQSSTNSLTIDSGEYSRLKNLVQLLENLLAFREKEIEDLKGQREWLKERIEKLEEQSDRDRLILLSETRSLQQLIRLQQSKKSSFRAALEYLKLLPPPEEQK